MIFQHSIPYDPLELQKLPGVSPLRIEDWIRIDEAYSAQMAEKARLLENCSKAVLACEDTAQNAADELLQLVVEDLQGREGFRREGQVMHCPDGRQQSLDAEPLRALAGLTQEDFCILQKRGAEHVLTGAALCFPASWLLSEKVGRGLLGVHEPVEGYAGDLARRVQRLFDGVQVGKPLWRFNALWYADPALHQPRSAHARRDERFAQTADYMRSELQTIRRLPKSGAVVFGIHTYVLKRSRLTKD